MSRPGWRCNVSELLLERSGAGTWPALRSPGGWVSRDELAGRVGALAAGLAERGVRRGTRVALVFPDSPRWIVTFLALARLGAVVALASPTLPEHRLGDAVRRAEPELVICDDEELVAGVAVLEPSAIDHLVERGGRDPGPAPTRAGDPCYLLLTSGSTGPSKWAIHRHGDIAACLATYGRHILALHPADVTWSVAVLATSYGFGNSCYFPLGAGASSWLTGEAPTPDEASRACSEGGANVLFGVPTFWARLARHAAEGRVAAAVFAGVRLAVSAGEPLPAAVWHHVRDVLGLELVDGLGSSEATNLYLSNRPGRARPGSIGSVVPGFDLNVVNAEGRVVPQGTPGELLVRGASVMSGYFGSREATGRTLRDGWLRTGDLVVQQPDATYRFVGRIGERFKSGGFWVDPALVEAALHLHPGVAEVAVTGAPDPAGVTRVVAIVVPRNHADPPALRERLEALAAAELAPHEAPREYLFVDRLPTSASGKVRRGELGPLAAGATASTGLG